MKHQKIAVSLTAAALLCGLVSWHLPASAEAGPALMQHAAGQLEPAPASVPVAFADYAPYGLRYDAEQDALYFEDELVRYFFDGVELENGGAISRCKRWNADGTVDVHTVRRTVSNGDGSVNPFGPLTGVMRYDQEAFDCRTAPVSDGSIVECATVEGDPDCNAPDFGARFTPYNPFGIEYRETAGCSGAGNVYCNGQLVRTFFDLTPAGGCFSYTSRDGGDLSVRTVYDGAGTLCGVELWDE